MCVCQQLNLNFRIKIFSLPITSYIWSALDYGGDTSNNRAISGGRGACQERGFSVIGCRRESSVAWRAVRGMRL